MKIKKIIVIGLLILIMSCIVKYVDLCVSQKYETQLEGLYTTKQQIKKSKELEKEISFNKKKIYYL